MTSFAKLEANNIFKSYQQKTKQQPQATCIKYMALSSALKFLKYRWIQTDTQTSSSQHSAPQPDGVTTMTVKIMHIM